jgi:beta-glucosidase
MQEMNAEKLDLEQAIAQLIVPRTSGFLLDRQRLYPQWELDSRAVDVALTYGVGGFLLFGGSLGDTTLKIKDLQAASQFPLLICADLEAGCGQHVLGASKLPTARAIGATGDRDFAFRAGALTAREALAIGINWVLAPCLDVNSNPKNPVIGLRAFHETPEVVATMGTAFAEGIQSVGALACGKHFPGHGDVEVDSHLTLPTLTRSRNQLDAEDWLPFKRAIQQGIGSIMSGHLQVPCLDLDFPATLSEAILTGLLRESWGFKGLIVSDALNMGAICQWPDLEVRALQAGIDILLMAQDVPSTMARILEAVRLGELSEGRVYASVERIFAAKQRIATSQKPIQQLEILGDLSLGETIAQKSVSVVRDQAALLPLDSKKSRMDVAIIDSLQDLLHFNAPAYVLEAKHDQTYLQFLLAEARRRDQLVVHILTPLRPFRGTSAVHGIGTQFLEQVDGHRTVLISYTNPYLGTSFPQISTVLNTYDTAPVSQKAAFAYLNAEL